jgi:hypothetical protein
MNVDDDGIKMFGMILIVAIVLILLSTCYFQSDEDNNGFDCPDGQVYLEEFNCCSLDGVSCFEPPEGCIVVPCDDPTICCEPDVCEVQPDNSEKCMPCSLSSSCNPEDENSCCTDMFCDLTGFCEECEDYPCNSIEDCCDDYECNDLLCESCERTCDLNEDCCDGWMCTIGECENCDRPCDPLNPCCEGDDCNYDTEKCEGCVEGAYCDMNKPCCPGYDCDLDSNECVSCYDRPCETNEDCCVNGMCNSITKLCQYPDDCEDLPCLNLGETCEICDDTECVECLDNTICVMSGGLAACKSSGDCPPGQYDCSDEYLNCMCCDAITGECASEKKIVECSDIADCEECSCISYDVLVCPQNNYYCPGKGCFNPHDNYYPLNSVCKTCTSISDPNACCTILVPEDAQSEAGVFFVPFTECVSGYKIEENGKCISQIEYDYDGKTEKYSYSFIYDDSGTLLNYIGISKAGPNELIITNARISDSSCVSLPGDEFKAPQLFNVG